VRTRVGYAGGSRPNPTYHSMGDHSESIQLDYDPSMISYSDLLAEFWRAHNPTRQAWSRQYMSAVFYADNAQRETAMEMLHHETERRSKDIYTAIQRVGVFTLAEDYHQKYSLRHVREVLNEFLAMYPRLVDFVNSTAVTRANGFAGGDGSMALLESEIDAYGLSAEAQQKLVEMARRYHR
jgi:peptide-methionine (S)-S-oxide reductase